MKQKHLFACGNAHTTVIVQHTTILGDLPNGMICSHLNCGTVSYRLQGVEVNQDLSATHEFYRPSFGDILTEAEAEFTKDGTQLIREIKGAQPKEVINEFKNTEEMIRIADFLISALPPEERKGSIADTVIRHFKIYVGHLNVMKTLREKNQNAAKN